MPTARVILDTDTTLQIRHVDRGRIGRASGPKTELQGFSAGAQVEQSDQEIEHIARAFFVAWHQDTAWETASRILKHEFRLYARQAIGMLEKKQERAWTAPREALSFDACEAA